MLSLNGVGLYTLMCGDGTNDVGGLKVADNIKPVRILIQFSVIRVICTICHLQAAHVGVSIVNDPLLESMVEHASQSVSSAALSGGKAGAKKAKGTSAKERLTRAMAEMQAQEADPTLVQLGDASVASPFTARRTSVDSVLTILRQGRCTLVTTIQVGYETYYHTFSFINYQT